jgi:hypothetical protein
VQRSIGLRRGSNRAPVRTDDRTAGSGTLALQLPRKMLSAGMSSTSHPDPALSRQAEPFERQAEACDAHASEMCADLGVVDRKRGSQ